MTRLRDFFRIGRFETGPSNSLVDVAGVRVGHHTIQNSSIQSGVTAIFPCANPYESRPAAGFAVLNGAGEITGTHQLREWGLLETPILLTNTLSVGTVQSGCVKWMISKHPALGDTSDVVIPVVGECDDSYLNDARAMPITEEMVAKLLDQTLLSSAAPAEGSVGAGTGMICSGFKSGIGNSSRKLVVGSASGHVGVLVLANFGHRRDLRIGGVPVGERWLRDHPNEPANPREKNYGSIVVVIATDLPLDSRQLSRLCTRAGLGVGRSGSYAGHNSGEVMVAFSTTRLHPRDGEIQSQNIRDELLDPVFEATIEATEEAIANSLCAAATTVGRNNRRIDAIDLAWLKKILTV